jgi:hypothetical protein
LKFKAALPERFFAALRAAGMPDVPAEFSVVPRHQVIPSATLAEIATFIRVFDTVTAREPWRAAALREAPAIAQLRRSEVCFFSAWDFHLPPEGGCQLIEFNDNGSGFLFAAIINDLYHDAATLGDDKSLAPPVISSAFNRSVGELVEQEVRSLLGEGPVDLFLILDDAESLRHGKFRTELTLLRDLFRLKGWPAEVGCPAQTRWDGRQLMFHGHPVSFIVNRSTKFFWQSEDFSALRQAYEAGRVYVAPNPFSYATRSDKRLLEWLSLSHWDEDLGIQFEERQVLSANMPETHLVRADNLEMLARRRREFVFKPLHGFAGRGLLDSAAVGRARLRRLVKHGEGYVAQRWVPKPCIDIEGLPLWTDLRVWAYRGQILLLSGRASRRLDRLELTPPGGWLPTYVSL